MFLTRRWDSLNPDQVDFVPKLKLEPKKVKMKMKTEPVIKCTLPTFILVVSSPSLHESHLRHRLCI